MEIKALILDFDMTLFDTRVDNDIRKSKSGKNINWSEVWEVIPQYKLYQGWYEVFDWLKENNIKVAIVSTAKTELIKRTLIHFCIDVDVVIGWQMYFRKPSGKLVDMAIKKLNVDKSTVISIGDSMIDKKMSDNGGVRFVGAIWDSNEPSELSQGDYISTPLDIITIK